MRIVLDMTCFVLMGLASMLIAGIMMVVDDIVGAMRRKPTDRAVKQAKTRSGKAAGSQNAEPLYIGAVASLPRAGKRADARASKTEPES